jgi:deoxyribodipyrimidine photolyase-related protein
MPSVLRHLVVVLGDQLDADSAAFDGFDPSQDAVWMCEVGSESTHVWSSQPRIAMFLSAMRHFRDALRARGWTVLYRDLESHDSPSLADALAEDLRLCRPRRVVAVRPGEWRLAISLPETAKTAGVPWAERGDRHFFLDPDGFNTWARGRREYRLEHFYRWMRRREGILMQAGGPVGGIWNFDFHNRASFGRHGPGQTPPPRRFVPDVITTEVIELVSRRFAGHPGELASFDWPVTAADAELALRDFIDCRLPLFGRFQDAMWSDQAWLYHSRLSAAMNLKLLSPRTVVAAAIAAYECGRAPLASVEGFVRQVMGWREFVRGMYWLRMPDFLQDNALCARSPLPGFYWTGDTDMACLRDALGQTLRLGYAHHIQRLMVIGLFAQLLGVNPRAVHEWFLAVYVDAVEWVELPNVLGMSQYADGGRMVSKPYVASGKYVQRMSNHCTDCRYRPDLAVGEQACPFTTLYWDFLRTHARRFASHPRTALQWSALSRLDSVRRAEIQEQATALRQRLAIASRLVDVRFR